MPADFTWLKDKLEKWTDSGEVASEAETIILFAEGELNRRLEGVIVDTTLTGTSGSRNIDIASLSVREPVALFYDYGDGERELSKRADGQFEYTDTAGEPERWSVDGDYIKFNCPLSGAYSFRFEYTAQFNLSDANPTNWLINRHPDAYFAACMAWGGLFMEDDARASNYLQMIERFISSINRQESKKNKGKLRVDVGLSSIGRYR